MKSVLLLVLLATLITSRGAAEADYDTKPVPLRTPPPEYSADLRAAAVEGLVVMELTIDEKGRVSGVLVRKSTDARLEDSATKAVKQWRFRPALKHGEPVVAKLAVPLFFKLDS